jgi:hypothetical protein
LALRGCIIFQKETSKRNKSENLKYLSVNFILFKKFDKNTIQTHCLIPNLSAIKMLFFVFSERI